MFWSSYCDHHLVIIMVMIRCTKCGDPFGDGEEMYLQGAAIWHPRCSSQWWSRWWFLWWWWFCKMMLMMLAMMMIKDVNDENCFRCGPGPGESGFVINGYGSNTGNGSDLVFVFIFTFFIIICFLVIFMISIMIFMILIDNHDHQMRLLEHGGLRAGRAE